MSVTRNDATCNTIGIYREAASRAKGSGNLFRLGPNNRHHNGDVAFRRIYFRCWAISGRGWNAPLTAESDAEPSFASEPKGLLSGHNGSRWSRADWARIAMNGRPLPAGDTNYCEILSVTVCNSGSRLFDHIGGLKQN